MTGKDQISVIVPVYNVKDYLERCFNSIIHQTYQNLEIILVDDGSTDGSSELCDELSKRDDRVRVVHKQNGGSGSAKNVGFRVASGDYIALVDSDDWIQTEMYQTLLHLIEKEEAQIAVCGIQKVTDEGRVSYYYDNLVEQRVFSRMEAMSELPRNEMITNSMCNKLFHAETIRGLQMDENLAYDDDSFVPLCIARANRIVFTGQPFYSYFERVGSISRRAFSVREFDRVTADRIRLDFYREYFPESEDAAAISYIGTCLKIYYEARGNKLVREERIQLREELKKVIGQYPDLPFTNKQRAKANLFKFSPFLYTVLMMLRGK